MLDYVFLIIGLSLLVFGGDILIRGAVDIANRFAIPPLIIGLTIVSFGTSAPELFISVNAALQGLGGMAVGNVVGSNIANILLVMGIPALIAASSCKEDGIGKNILVMLGFTLVFMVMLLKGTLNWYDGLILLMLLGWFLFDQYIAATSGKSSLLEISEIDTQTNMLKSLAFLIVGIALLPLGAHMTVTGAQAIASSFGVSDAIIGLTVVAIGTSLPELAASVMAVLRGDNDVALGNVVGSNIFNIAAIMGITSLITPVISGNHIVSFDMWVMLAVSILLGLIAHYLKVITFKTGLAMISTYAIYVVIAFL